MPRLPRKETNRSRQDGDDMNLIEPIVYLIDGDILDSVTVEMTHEDPAQWAVRKRGMCMDINGMWSLESLPSGRDEAWLELHRFDNHLTATRVYDRKGC